MPLNVTLDLPADLEEKLRREHSNLAVEVKEAYALELFRHQVFEGSLSMGDLEADRETLSRVMNKAR
jgi:hypothetical protein